MFLNSKSSFVCFDEMQSLGKYKKSPTPKSKAFNSVVQKTVTILL
ncbi:hypothetical protein [Niallia taxi]